MCNLKKLFLTLLVFVILGFAGYFFVLRKSSIYSARDYIRIANHFKTRGQTTKEVKFLKKALTVNPNNFFVNKRLGVLHYELDYDQEAIAYFKKAYELNDKAKDCLYYISYISYHKNYDAQSAVKAMEEYITFDKHNVTAYIILHDCYMKLHEFEKAREQDNKIDMLLIEKGVVRKLVKHWDGSDLRGKTILLRDNVGIGDIFCWLRYAKKLKESGAKVILEVRPYLFPILSKCPYIDSFVSYGETLPYFDFQTTTGKIPHFFVKNVDSMKTDIPYMYSDDVLTSHWKKRLSKDTNFKVGICWDPCVYKNKNNGTVRKNRRAVPLSFFGPLSQIKNVSFYSLQRVNGMDQIKNGGFPLSVFDENFDKSHGSFSDTAAVMKNLDLVITADTSVAHLAGALGVPVWVLLPFVPDWRWTIAEGSTPMYPTMRLFRQKKLGNWELAVSDVYHELCKLVKGHK